MLRPKPFALGVGSIPLILVLLAGLLNAHNIAPAFSSNPSLTRKAEFLRTRMDTCELVVLGSSTALNNLDSGLLEKLTGYGAINLGYWGAAPSETLLMFRELARGCTPKVAVLPVQFYDFYAAWNNEETPRDFFRYVRNDSPLRLVELYVSRLLPTLSEQVTRHDVVFRDPARYESLAFNANGDVLLACKGFHYDPARWDGFRKVRLADLRGERIQQELAAFRKLLELAKSKGTRVFVLRTPMTARAERELARPDVSIVLRNVKRYSRESGAQFVFVRNDDGTFGDELFSDYSHLNGCGAERLTRVLANRIIAVGLGSPRREAVAAREVRGVNSR